MKNSLKYDLTFLEWQQFEILSFQCLQINISPSVQFFDSGKDKGRDIIYTGVTNYFDSLNENRKYIFQVKHKSTNTSFTILKKDLSVELNKVYIKHKFDFDFYCLVTNIAITANEYDQLKIVFDNFITENNLSSSIKFSVYGYRHFESCIDKSDIIKWNFPSIIKNTDFKYLLNDIINKQENTILQGWSAVFENNKTKFIYTSIYEDALQKLNDNNILLLSGPPKSGKTFNAEMIIFNKYCRESYLLYNIDRIEEFEKYYDINKKQIFLFDDAFGKHNIDFYRADTFDRKIEFIFQLIDDNHKCIFTSREYIYRAFVEYSEKDYIKFINKIIVEVSSLSNGEKESIFKRYFTIRFPDIKMLDESKINDIILHKNFSPETIRAYFENSKEFIYDDFINHLKLPDKYLEKVFNNLTKEKRIVLLSLLFSIDEDELSISHAFNNVCSDLNTTLLTNLNDQLILLEGSIIKSDNRKYYFYHPSMFDFFVHYLSKDIATYRNLLFKNINIGLLTLTRFIIEPKTNCINIVKEDIVNLTIGFQRLICNPYISLIEINSLLAWLENPDVLINFKMKLHPDFNAFISELYNALYKLDFCRFQEEDAYHISNFFHRLKYLLVLINKKIFLSESDFKSLLLRNNNKDNYWLIVFSITPFLEQEFIYENIGKTWLNNFYSQLKNEIDSLGNELYGDAYPYFEEVSRYKKLLEEKKVEEANMIKKKSIADYMQKTKSNWYPRFTVCKEKMLKLKGSHPYGFKIYQKLSWYFEHLRVLEDHQKNRYIFNKSKKWW